MQCAGALVSGNKTRPLNILNGRVFDVCLVGDAGLEPTTSSV